MHLLTWHGTVVCLPDQSGTIRHRPLPLAEDAMPALEMAPEQLRNETRSRHPFLGDIRVQATRMATAIHILRDRFFMCADANTQSVVFDRGAANDWETLLPVSARDFADLEHILRHRWVVQATREVVPRRSIYLTDGFWLRVGGAALDLGRELPFNVPERDESGLPKRLILPNRRGDTDLVIAEPRGSALLSTALWPVRSRRVAELLAIAVHRHIRGFEPTEEELERDAQFLETRNGAAGLEDLLEQIVPDARSHQRASGSGEGVSARASALDIDLAAAQRHVEAARTGQAMAAFERLAADYPDDPRPWFILGRMRQEAGDYGAAAGAWERCLLVEPGHTSAISSLAAMAGSLGRPLEAVSRFEVALDHGPEDAVHLRVLLASRYADLNWLDQAAAQFDKIDGVLTGWMEASRRETLSALDRQRAMLASLKKREAETGGLLTSDELMKKARASFITGDLTASYAAISDLLAQDSTKLAPHLLRGELLARDSGIGSAIDYLRSLSDAFGSDAAFVVGLARWLHATCRYAEAESVLRALISIRPHEDAYHLLAMNALCRDDVAALSRVTRAWQAFDSRSIAVARFTIAEARAAGRVARLDDGEMAIATPNLCIVQFWNTPDIPPDVAATMASWPQRNPGVDHLVFDHQAARAFMERHCAPNVVECYDSANHPAMQSDLFRLAYLSLKGGIYVDADELCTRDMRPVFASLSVAELGVVQSTETPPYIYNGFIVAKPGCSIIRETLNEAVRLVSQHLARDAKPDIWQVTGPGPLTRAIGRSVADPDTKTRVLILTESEYHAFSHTQDLRYKHTNEGDWRLN